MDQNNSHGFGKSSNFERQSEVNDNIVDNSNSDNLMYVLDNFRENWRRELKNKNYNTLNDFEDHLSTDVEMKAMELFKEGILLEQRGKIYDAVAFYRRATQLVPDIEYKTYRMETQMHSSDDSALIPGAETLSNADLDSDQTFGDLDDECDLISRFIHLNSDEFGNLFICSPLQPTSKTHFSCLPFEVVLNILKWIVTNELDLRSLEKFGSVCRGFYIASRDAELWRLSCLNTWGPSGAGLVASYGNNWRNMFVERVRPNFNGTYISRTTYIRQGEASFQDVHYRPCYLVEYYRYIRFFPNGHVLMLTTADDPQQSLPLLRHRKPKNNNVLVGHYWINGQTISIVITRDYISDSQLSRNKNKNKSRDKNSMSTQTLNISLDVKTVKKRRNHQLLWKHYLVQYKKSNGQEWANTFDLSQNKFPPFLFSRVKSYISDAEYKLM